MKKLIDLAVITTTLALIGCNAPDNVAGKVDDTTTDLPGLISPAGKPIAGASVKVFKSGDTTGTIIDSLVTDTNGQYQLNKLPDGYYAIWAKTDSSVFYKDSIFVGTGALYDSTDTLREPRTIFVPVKVERQDLPSIIEAQILGTDIHPNVNLESYLVLDGMPNGKFSVRIYTKSANYTAKSWPIIVNENTPDTLDTTWSMVYTGIPVVNGLSAKLDTATGIASISWNKTDYKFFQRYDLYRTRIDTDLPTPLLIASVPDTSFSDNLFSKNLATGTYQYKVAIRTLTEDSGQVLDTVSIHYVNPATELNILADSARSVFYNQPVSVPLYISPWFGTNPTITYQIGTNGTVSTASGTSIVVTPNTTLGDGIPLIVTVAGNGRSKSDTTFLTNTINWNRTGTAPATGTILQPLVNGSSIYLPVLSNGTYALYHSTDNGVTWSNLTKSAIATSDSSEASNPVFWQNRFWIVDGSGNLFSSPDGTTWSLESSQPIDPRWEGFVEHKTLAVTKNGLELLIENSADRASGGTELTFWRYDSTQKIFTPAFAKNSKRQFISHYWIETTNDGFRVYTISEEGGANNIQRYSAFSSISLDGTVPYAPVSMMPLAGSIRLSAISLCGGLILADMDGESKPLFVKSTDLWNETTVSQIEKIGTMPVAPSQQFFAIGSRLFAINGSNGEIICSNQN